MSNLHSWKCQAGSFCRQTSELRSNLHHIFTALAFQKKKISPATSIPRPVLQQAVVSWLPIRNHFREIGSVHYAAAFWAFCTFIHAGLECVFGEGPHVCRGELVEGSRRQVMLKVAPGARYRSETERGVACDAEAGFTVACLTAVSKL